MKYRHLITLALIAAVSIGIAMSGTPGSIADDQKAADRKEVSAFMRAKLASSQKVLEGLCTKDYDLIAAGAKELEQMSDAAAFQRYPDPVYRHYSREFRRLAGKLNRLGVDRNRPIRTIPSDRCRLPAGRFSPAGNPLASHAF